MRETTNFPEWEWNCQCKLCNQAELHNMLPEVMLHAQAIREYLGRPVTLSSAYRCASHPMEARKSTPGQHHLGTAFDIKVTSGAEAADIIQYAIRVLGVVGFAYSKKLGFVHLDWREGVSTTWNY